MILWATSRRSVDGLFKYDEHFKSGKLKLYSKFANVLGGKLCSLASVANLMAKYRNGTTPVLRRRLDEQFRQGARNQAFLVESLTGMESVKWSRCSPCAIGT